MKILNASDIEVVSFSKDEHADMLIPFSCGQQEEHQSIAQYFFDCQKHPDAKLYVVKNTSDGDIIGLFALSCSSIIKMIDDASRNNTLPAIELKAFALSEKYQHKTVSPDITIGDLVLGFIKAKVKWIVTNICGARYLILYSVASAERFYTRNGFAAFDQYIYSSPGSFSEGCTGMFMNIEDVFNTCHIVRYKRDQ